MNRRSFLASSLAAAVAAPPQPRKPNILLILADDLGYSDIGCFGGEIRTPNLDRLAREGVRFTHFYNTARCCPSRASLMTGLYPHQAGVGAMTAPKPPAHGLPGYQNRLGDRCATIPEVLRPAGYTTLMAGKWHLGQPVPTQRGFEEFYGMVHGFDSFWNPNAYTRLPEGRQQRSYPEGQFYSTHAITDHALDFLTAARQRRQPWFLYLAYNAPHFPLHAPRDVIDRYVPVYEKGWDQIRARRFQRLRELGLIDERWELTPRSFIPANRYNTQTGWADKYNPAWDSLPANRRADLARRMAIFAAMVDVMDQNIGRILKNLESAQELDNTLILFLSDNGACAEWDPYGFDNNSGPTNVLHEGAALERMGQPGTYHSYGSGWANACNTPFRLYKHYNHEGGICTPFIARWPPAIPRRGAIEHQPAHLIDILPTFLEAARARFPSERNGEKIPPPEGVSLLPALAGKPLQRREALYFEHEGNRAVRDGNWKLVAVGAGGDWELYDMDKDPTEMHNLAARHPQRVRDMARRWEQWARRTGAIPWPWTPPYGGGKESAR